VTRAPGGFDERLVPIIAIHLRAVNGSPGEAMGARGNDRRDRVRDGAVWLAAAVLVVGSAVWGTTLQLREGWPVAATFVPAGAFAAWGVACGVATLLGRLRPAWSLTRAERLTLWWAVFGGSVVLPVAGGTLLVTVAGRSYFAFDSPEVAPRVPWLAVDPGAARRWYEGGPPDPLPWLLPLAAAGISLAALIAAQALAAIALVCRWRSEERLPFPLVQLPLAVVGEGRSLGRTPAFWLGSFAAAAAFAVARWHGAEPSILAGETISPLALGLAYLATPAVNLGIALTGGAVALLPWLAPIVGWRVTLADSALEATGLGAAVAITALTLWPLARTGGSGKRRSGWRAAAIVALHLPAVGWASLHGERPAEIVATIAGFWMLLIPILRLAVHAGLPLLPVPIGPGAALGMLATHAPGPAAVAWAQVGSGEGEQGRLATRAMALGMVLAAVAAIATALVLGWRHGAVNFGDLAPLPPPAGGRAPLLPAFAVGAGLAAALAAAQRRWSGWPVAPLALVLLAMPDLLAAIWPSVLAGWAIARWAAHVGGRAQYLRLRPLLLGLIAGELLALAGVGVWRTLL